MESKTIKRTNMNSTLINEKTLLKLKKKVSIIEGLEMILSCTNKLTPEEEIKLTKARKKLNELIKAL